MTDETVTLDRETKAVHHGHDPVTDTMMRTFDAYKQENDARLVRLEQGKSIDPLTEEKLARMDRALDETNRRIQELTTKNRRPMLETAERVTTNPDILAHKAAFNHYLRTGETTGLKALEMKALSAGVGADGGFLVTPPLEREILFRMATVSPIRSIASVRTISASTFKKAYSTTGPSTGWVSETASRPEKSSQVIAELTFPAMELYAMPSATQTLLDDAAVDIEQWIADEIFTVFAEQEGAAFVSGDGTNKPTGFLAATKVAQSSWSWSKLGYIATGTAAALNATNPSDAFVDLIYALKAGYRQNATFVMNRKTQATIRKLKATTGEYLWQPPSSIGQPATLMNFPLVEAEDMPDIGTDTYPVALGNFSRGYLIVDRIGVRSLRDPFSAKPYVLFYTTKRVGGGIQDFDAIKLLKCGTS